MARSCGGPGSTFSAVNRPCVHGYHRSLCVYSFVHRGTPEEPGLVLGLDRGGSCHGMAFQIAPERWDDTIAYLRAREQVTSVYVEKRKSVRLLASGHRPPRPRPMSWTEPISNMRACWTMMRW